MHEGKFETEHPGQGNQYTKMVPVTRGHRLRRVAVERVGARDASPHGHCGRHLCRSLLSSLTSVLENCPDVVTCVRGGILQTARCTKLPCTQVTFPGNWAWDGEAVNQARLCAGTEGTRLRELKLPLWCEHVECVSVMEQWKRGRMHGQEGSRPWVKQRQDSGELEWVENQTTGFPRPLQFQIPRETSPIPASRFHKIPPESLFALLPFFYLTLVKLFFVNCYQENFNWNTHQFLRGRRYPYL